MTPHGFAAEDTGRAGVGPRVAEESAPGWGTSGDCEARALMVVLAVRGEPGRLRASPAAARHPVSTTPPKCQLTLKLMPDWSRVEAVLN